MKQSEAVRHVKSLLAQRGLHLEPGILIIGEIDHCQVFEYKGRCISVDTKAGIWVGIVGGKWERISDQCTTSSVIEAIEFLNQV
jgi:hypothetical protein